MIEKALKSALERITGLKAYPLLLPDTVQNGVTFQRISDAEVGSGLVRTGLVDARIQVNLYLVDDYTRLLKLDKALWDEFKNLTHGQLEGFPVQYVERGSIQQDKVTLPGRSIQYRLIRDFIFTIPE